MNTTELFKPNPSLFGNFADTRVDESRKAKDIATIEPKTRGKYSPVVALIYGRRHKGKSLFMSMLGYQLRQSLRALGNHDVRVGSNYQYRPAYEDGLHSPYIVEEVVKYPMWANNLILCIDEVQTKALSRRSMSANAVNLMQFMVFVRKMGIDLIATTQFPQTLDQQMLMQVDWVIEVSSNWNQTKIRTWIHDYWGQFSERSFRKSYMPPPRREADGIRTFHIQDPRFFYDMYDTDQIIQGAYMSDEAIANLEMRADARRLWPERLPGFDADPSIDEEFDDPLGPDDDPLGMEWAVSFPLVVFCQSKSMQVTDAVTFLESQGCTVTFGRTGATVHRSPE